MKRRPHRLSLFTLLFNCYPLNFNLSVETPLYWFNMLHSQTSKLLLMLSLFHLCLRTYFDKSVHLWKYTISFETVHLGHFSHLRDIVSKFTSLVSRFLRIGGAMKHMCQSLHLLTMNQPLHLEQKEEICVLDLFRTRPMIIKPPWKFYSTLSLIFP